MVYTYTVEKKENQSQMFNRNNLKMMMVEVCEKNKRDDGLETVVYFFFMEDCVLWLEYCHVLSSYIAVFCTLIS